MKTQTCGFGVDPAQSPNHFFVLIPSKEQNASPLPVQVYERCSWTDSVEQALDAADKLRIEISRHKCGEVKAALTAEFNSRLKKDGLKSENFPQSAEHL